MFFNIIIGINESRILTKDISCKSKCKFDGRKWNLNQKWNNDKFRCECKNPKESNVCKKKLYLESCYMCCENGKYLASAESIGTTNAVPTKTVQAKITSINFYILLSYLLITIVLLTAISIYCCFIKYQTKEKYLLLSGITGGKIIEVLY